MQARLIMDKVNGVFRRSGASVVSGMLTTFHEAHPAFPVRGAFILACRLSAEGTGAHPSYQDVSLLRPLLAPSLSDEAAANLIIQASKGEITDERALEECPLLAVRSIEERRDFAGALLKLAPLNRPLEQNFLLLFERICDGMGLSSDDRADVLAAHGAFREERERLLNSTAGLVTALVVILIFILAATYLKVVFFGFLLAYLFLPMEKFFERQIFASPVYRFCSERFKLILLSISLLRAALTAGAGFGRCRL